MPAAKARESFNPKGAMDMEKEKNTAAVIKASKRKSIATPKPWNIPLFFAC
jgi:hypothetical protein